MRDGRLRVGDVEIVALRDSTIELPLAQMFPDVPATAYAPFRERHPSAFTASAWVVPVRAFLLRSGGRAYLVDTGLGTMPEVTTRFGGTGRLLEALEGERIAAEEVAVVILTHIHLDHVGGAVRPDGAPAFPRARYLLHRADLERARALAATSPLQDRTVLALERLGRLEAVEDGAVVDGAIQLLHAPGHTPGSQCALIRSRGEGAILTGDALPHPVHVTEPGWRYTSDGEHERAVATREALLARIEAEGLTVAPTHFPEPFGSLVQIEGKRYWTGG